MPLESAPREKSPITADIDKDSESIRDENRRRRDICFPLLSASVSSSAARPNLIFVWTGVTDGGDGPSWLY